MHIEQFFWTKCAMTALSYGQPLCQVNQTTNFDSINQYVDEWEELKFCHLYLEFIV